MKNSLVIKNPSFLSLNFLKNWQGYYKAYKLNLSYHDLLATFLTHSNNTFPEGVISQDLIKDNHWLYSVHTADFQLMRDYYLFNGLKSCDVQQINHLCELLNKYLLEDFGYFSCDNNFIFFQSRKQYIFSYNSIHDLLNNPELINEHNNNDTKVLLNNISMILFQYIEQNHLNVDFNNLVLFPLGNNIKINPSKKYFFSNEINLSDINKDEENTFFIQDDLKLLDFLTHHQQIIRQVYLSFDKECYVLERSSWLSEVINFKSRKIWNEINSKKN